MFCANCGRALPPEAERCPGCGESAALAEYCGGFWGLTEGGMPERKAPDPDASLIAQREALREQLRTREKRERRLLFVIIGLSVLLILLAAATLLHLRADAAADARRAEETEETVPADESDAPEEGADFFFGGSGANP